MLCDTAFLLPNYSGEMGFKVPRTLPSNNGSHRLPSLQDARDAENLDAVIQRAAAVWAGTSILDGNVCSNFRAHWQCVPLLQLLDSRYAQHERQHRRTRRQDLNVNGTITVCS